MSRTKRWPTVEERIDNLRRSILDLQAEISRLKREGDPGPVDNRGGAIHSNPVFGLMRGEHIAASRKRGVA